MKTNIIKISAAAISLTIILTPLAFAAGIENPLKFGTSLGDLVTGIMKFVVRVGGLISVFMFIYTGFKFVQAQGDPKGIQSAKDMFFGTVIGVAVLLGAQLIASIIVNTVQGVTQ